MYQGLCVDKAEAVHLILQGPVVEGVQDELAHTGMAAVEHPIVAVVGGSIKTPQR